MSAGDDARAFGRHSECWTKIGSILFANFDELRFVFSGDASCEQDALVGHARAVVDPVVDGEPVAKVLEHGAARRSAAIMRKRGMISRSKKTCIRNDLLLERVERSRNIVASLSRYGSRSAAPPASSGELEPRLGMARLVLHHRRVVELRLGVRRGIRKSWVAISTASSSAWSCCMITERHRSRRRASFCGEPLYSGIGGCSPQGRSRTCHSARLRELVVAQDSRVGAAIVVALPGRRSRAASPSRQANVSRRGDTDGRQGARRARLARRSPPRSPSSGGSGSPPSSSATTRRPRSTSG